MTFIKTLDEALGQKTKKNFLPMRPGDVVTTYADVKDLKRDVDFEPKTQLNEGISEWIFWYRQYIFQ